MVPPAPTTATWKSKLGTEYPKELIDRLDAEHHKLLKGLRSLPENRHCADCAALETNWASVNLGVFLCTRCASVHRGLGTHVSKIKSCMGTYLWGPDEIVRMKEMGNGRGARVYLGRNAPRDLPGPDENEASLKAFAQKKYEHRLWALPEEEVAATKPPAVATKRTPEERAPATIATAGSTRHAAPAAVQAPAAQSALQKPAEQFNHSAAPTAVQSAAAPAALLKPAQPTEAFFDDFFGSLFGEDQQPQKKEPTLLEAFASGFPEPAFESPMAPLQTGASTVVAAAPGGGVGKKNPFVSGGDGGGEENMNPFLFDPMAAPTVHHQQVLEPAKKTQPPVAAPSPLYRKVVTPVPQEIDWFEGW